MRTWTLVQSFISIRAGVGAISKFFSLPSLCFPFLFFYFLVDKLTAHFRKQQCTCRGKNCYEIRQYINSHVPDSFHHLDRTDSKGNRYSIIPEPLFNYSNFKISIIHFPLFIFHYFFSGTLTKWKSFIHKVLNLIHYGVTGIFD